jgi:hypothetical protein
MSAYSCEQAGTGKYGVLDAELPPSLPHSAICKEEESGTVTAQPHAGGHSQFSGQRSK